MNRSTDRRDAPIWWCVFGVLPMIFAVAGFLLWHEDAVNRGSLKQASGRLAAFDFPPMGRAVPRGIRVFLEDKSDGGKFYVADQRICSDHFPSLRTLRVGDQVTVLMRTYELSTTSSLWELRRGSEVLLSYDQTRLGFQREANVWLLLAWLCVMAAAACQAAGLRARRSTGSWT